MEDVFFVLYAAMIPAVPLYGAKHYKKNKNEVKRLVCWGLFAVQTLISAACIFIRLK